MASVRDPTHPSNWTPSRGGAPPRILCDGGQRLQLHCPPIRYQTHRHAKAGFGPQRPPASEPRAGLHVHELGLLLVRRPPPDTAARRPGNV
eukprot:scaffold459_cov391-Prasinococcus_capsulatus_cf.AAC.10